MTVACQLHYSRFTNMAVGSHATMPSLLRYRARPASVAGWNLPVHGSHDDGQAVKAVEITKPRTAIPIHFNDFSVFRSGLDDFKKAAQASTTSTEFVYLAHGETYTFKPNV